MDMQLQPSHIQRQMKMAPGNEPSIPALLQIDIKT